MNPSRQVLEQNLLIERSELEVLRGQEKSLLALQSKLREDLKQLNSQEASLTPLLREVELAEARHKSQADELGQARSKGSPDAQRILSLTVVQPATFPMRPSGPRPIASIVLGLAASLASGLAAAPVAARLVRVLASTAGTPWSGCGMCRSWGILPPRLCGDIPIRLAPSAAASFHCRVARSDLKF